MRRDSDTLSGKVTALENRGEHEIHFLGYYNMRKQCRHLKVSNVCLFKLFLGTGTLPSSKHVLETSCFMCQLFGTCLGDLITKAGGRLGSSCLLRTKLSLRDLA